MRKSSTAKFTLYPLLYLSICFALGVIAADFIQFDLKIYGAICAVCFFLSIVFIKRKFVLIFIFAGFFAAGALHLQIEKQSVGANRIRRIYDEKRIVSAEPVEIEGVLQSNVELAADGFFILIEAEKIIYKGAEIEATGSVKFFAPVRDEQTKNEYAQFDLRYGSRVRVACNLEREDNFLNAGVLSQTKILDQQKIDAAGIIKSSLLVEKIGEEKIFAPLGWIYDLRQTLIADFYRYFKRPTAGVLIASLLGDEYFLDKDTADVFRAGGTFHVLVISGLHITFIGGLTLLFVRFFTRQRLWQFVIASFFLWTYSLAVGGGVPVVRATIMFTILLFSQIIYRKGNLINAFGLCALILLVWRPLDVFSSSFQLTFASVGAIILTAFPLIENLRSFGDWSPSTDSPFPPKIPVRLKRFCETLYWRKTIWESENKRQIWTANLFKSPYPNSSKSENLQSAARYFLEAIIVSFIAQAWLLPFLILYFHRLSFLTILLNIWVGIVIALESFAAIFAVAFAHLSETLALPLIKLTEILNWLLVAVPGFFTNNDWASVRVPNYTGAAQWIYVLYFAPLIFLTVALNLWKPFAVASKNKKPSFNIFAASNLRIADFAFLILVSIIVFHPFSQPRGDGRLQIDFLDVGQGDAALIRFPNGETLLVDGGGKTNFRQSEKANDDEDEETENFEPDSQSIGERVVSNFLWNKGYSQINYILATHADADHIQGLADVAKNFRVSGAFFGRTPLKNAEFANVFSILQKRGIESATISRGDILSFDDVKIEVLSPEKDTNADAISDNNHSIVLRLNFGERKILMTGDIEKETENELLQSLEFLRSDVVKVAHHGSQTSSTQNFINQTKAKLAIISVGRNSPFGHPREEVVERWKNSGAMVLTTGENGTITVSTDGSDLQLKIFNKQKILR